MKKIVLATVLTLGLATAGYVYAHGGYGYDGGYGMMGSGYGMMGGGRMMGSGSGCPGYGWNGAANGWNTAENQNFLQGTVQLRKQLNDRRFDYREALRNPNTTPEQLAKIEKEMIDLRTQIDTKAQQSK